MVASVECSLGYNIYLIYDLRNVHADFSWQTKKLNYIVYNAEHN